MVFKGCDVTIYPGVDGRPTSFTITEHHYDFIYELTDEQVVALLRIVVGSGKPVSSQVMWGAVYWFLVWACNYPPRFGDFCAKINSLPGIKELEFPCVYDSVRKGGNYGFILKNALFPDNAVVSKSELSVFVDYRHVAYTMRHHLREMVA